MKTTWAMLAVVLALLSCVCASADTYYVATGGVDDNSGSSALPWATLQHAVDSIAPGDTILVRAGTYAGCRIGQPGEAGAVKTLAAESGAAVVVNAPGPENRHGSIVEVENWDLADGIVRYWVIDGLEICNSPTRYGLDMRNTQYLTVRNCVVHGNTVTGIFDAFSDDNVYEFNESYNNGEHGFYHSNSGDRVTLRGNRSHHNYGCGIHMNGDASMGGDGVISNAVVERNIIWENATGGGGSAINCDGVSDSVIRNNLLYNNHASGISLYGGDAAEGSSRDKVCNNTIIMPADSRWAVNIKAATDGQPGPTGNVVANNLLYSSHSWHGVITIEDTSELAVSDYNVVMDRFGYPDDGTVIGLTEWQGLGYDAHSIIATPDQLFVDATGNDYHLAAASPAIGAATILPEVTDDIDGAPRTAPYDIGCYQTGGEPAPPTADFSASVRSGLKPLTVSFADHSTGAPTAWLWDFGDGDISTDASPSHEYAEAGAYTVSLTVTNSEGSDTEAKADFVKVATFSDVLPDFWAWAEVEACAANGVVQGYWNGTYRPSEAVTRDQMAVYVARALAGGDAAVPTGPSPPTFPDVPTDHWAFRYVEYAAQQHIVTGYPNGAYAPAVAVDRGQMAVYIARALVVPSGDAGVPTPGVTPTFIDVTSDNAWSWCYPHVEFLANGDIVQGYWDGYHPERTVTRDQMAVYVARAFGLGM